MNSPVAANSLFQNLTFASQKSKRAENNPEYSNEANKILARTGDFFLPQIQDGGLLFERAW